jgi:hypothetical protein
MLLGRDFGFTYLAMENGPIATRYAHGSRDSLIAFVRAFPNALAMATDEDLELQASAATVLGGPEPVWGLDQEFGALHVLRRLQQLAPRGSAPLLDSLVSAVAASEGRRFNRGGRHWLALDSRAETFERVRAELEACCGGTAGPLLAALGESARLYALNRSARGTPPTGFDANNDREELMKRTFVRFYREAERRDRRAPKVLVKMGTAHLGRGQSPFSPFALGNFLGEFATENGARYVNIIALAHNPAADTLAPSLWRWADLRPLAAAAPVDRYTLVDLRPLRAYAHARRLGTLLPDLRRTIFAYDFALLMGGARPATESWLDADSGRSSFPVPGR